MSQNDCLLAHEKEGEKMQMAKNIKYFLLLVT